MKHGRIIAGVTAVLLIAAAALAWLVPGKPEAAPDISIFTVDGKQLAFSSLRGKPVVVTFWATTCESCVREIPDLIDLYRKLSPQGLEIVAIAMDYDPPNRVLTLRKTRDIPYTVALDIHADAARAFGNIRLTPTTFLIAPDGRIVYRKIGDLPFDHLQQDIMTLLEQSPASNHAQTG